MKSPSLVIRSKGHSPRRAGDTSPPRQRGAVTAVQIFVFRAATFVGVQVFDAREPLTIGRSPGCALVLEGDTVSRKHCRVVVEAGQLEVQDLGSANGTFVNRRRVRGHATVSTSDAIHVGVYTLKMRPLRERSAGPVAEEEALATTRIEAVLWIGTGANEAPIDISPSVDRRLYDEAVRRAHEKDLIEDMVHGPSTEEHSAGHEAATPTAAPSRPSRALRLVEQVVDEVDEEEADDSQAIDAEELEARLRDLDHLIALLDEKDLAEGSAESRASTVVGDERPRARGPKTPQGFEPPPPEAPFGKTRPKVASRLTTRPRSFTSSSPFSRAHPGDYAAGAHVSLREPLSSEGPVPHGPFSDDEGSTSRLEETEAALQRARQARRHPVETTSRSRQKTFVEARLVTPPVGLGIQASAVREKSEEASYDDVWAAPSQTETPWPRTGETPRPSGEGKVATTPPRSTPSASNGPAPTPAMDDAFSTVTAADSRLQAAAQTDYDAVEIAARAGGTIIDVTKLYDAGEQYVLGHRTRDGRIAPAFAHPGLRLVRINADRTVDLVFPREIGGHLIRGRETVLFSELAEGRKYSSLRLETQDVATVILGRGQETICYHVRFVPSGGRSKLLGRRPEER